MDPKLNKLSVQALREEYRKALKQALRYGARSPEAFKARVARQLKREGVANPSPAQWAWGAICEAEEHYVGWCDGESQRRMEGDWD